MGRSAYTNSTGSSIRTFQTQPTSTEAAITKPKRSLRLPSLRSVKLPAKRLPWTVAVVLALISLFLFSQYNDAKAKLRAPAQSAAVAKQVSDTLTKVGRIAVLPTDEKPSVVTVSDASKLQSQSFFAHAKDGDKVIVYTKAKEAILYRPSTNQIVTIAPVSAAN